MWIVKKKEITIMNILLVIKVQQCPSKTKNNHKPVSLDHPVRSNVLNSERNKIWQSGCIFFFESVMGNPQTLFSPGVVIIPAVTVSSISRNWRDSNHGPPALWRHHHPQSPFGSFPNDIRTIWVIRNSSKSVSIHIKNIIWENIQKI